MLYQYAPLVAFIGLILVIAGLAMLAQKDGWLALSLVALGELLEVALYL